MVDWLVLALCRSIFPEKIKFDLLSVDTVSSREAPPLITFAENYTEAVKLNVNAQFKTTSQKCHSKSEVPCLAPFTVGDKILLSEDIFSRVKFQRRYTNDIIFRQ